MGAGLRNTQGTVAKKRKKPEPHTQADQKFKTTSHVLTGPPNGLATITVWLPRLLVTITEHLETENNGKVRPV